MKMKIHKKLVCTVLAIVCIVCNTSQVRAAEYWPEGPEVNGQSAIIMEANTGAILYEKAINDKHYPASITKILTALIAIENCPLDEMVTFSKEAVYETAGGSSIARDVGEKMTMEQCLYGMMLESANECAYAIAEHVGGTFENFVQMMNDKAKELGCTDSHFNNPHGLPDEQHYTSAHDMALIAQAAYSNESFRIICGTKNYTIPFTNKHASAETYLNNHHKMLHVYKTDAYVYDYCTGGKTGYTTVAGSTLVTYAEKDGMTLICVILEAEGENHYIDTRNLFNYCFENFQVCNVAEEQNKLEENEKTGITGSVENFAEIDPKAVIVLPKTAEFGEVKSEPSYENADNEIIATLQYTFAGHNVGEADVLVSDTEMTGFNFTKGNGIIENESVQNENAKNKNVKEINVRKILWIVGIIAAILILIWIFIHLTGNFGRLRHRLQRNKRQKYKKIRGKK